MLTLHWSSAIKILSPSNIWKVRQTQMVKCVLCNQLGTKLLHLTTSVFATLGEARGSQGGRAAGGKEGEFEWYYQHLASPHHTCQSCERGTCSYWHTIPPPTTISLHFFPASNIWYITENIREKSNIATSVLWIIFSLGNKITLKTDNICHLDQFTALRLQLCFLSWKRKTQVFFVPSFWCPSSLHCCF